MAAAPAAGVASNASDAAAPRPTALEGLAAGRACIVATDTVYGLAALPGSEGYGEVFRLKRRPRAQVLPWLVGGEADLDRYGSDVPAYAHDLAGRFWPGALTLVVRASREARALGGTAEDGTVALRCPDEAACLSLIAALGKPLACTSANLHGAPAVSGKPDLPEAFKTLPGYTELPETCKGGHPSTIVDCTAPAPRILRKGPITL